MKRPGSLLTTIRRAVWPLIIFGARINLLTAVILDPLVFFLLERIVALSGDPFVGNTALVSFAISPAGLAAFAVAGISLTLLNMMALGGDSLVLWYARQGHVVRQFVIWHLLIRRLPSLFIMAILALGTGLLLTIPVVVTALALRHLWLSPGDLYFYISTRPPEFLGAAAVVALVAVISAVAGLYLLLRTCLALPLSLLDGVGVTPALQAAMRATKQRVKVPFFRLVLTALILALLWIAISVAFFRLLELLATFAVTDEMLQWLGLLFAIAAASVAAVLTGLTRASILLVLIVDRAAEDVLPAQIQPTPVSAATVRLRVIGALLIFAVISAATLIEAARATQSPSGDGAIAITAHRAGSRRAPENTIAALRAAIADGADDVEIDVQETADGNVVLLHDTDLRRVAGVARPVWDMRLDELQALDAGSWFSPEFRGEQIPTLAQFAVVARGRVGLNVELKNNGRGEDLAARTVAVLRETGTSAQAAISSLDLSLLRQVQHITSEVKVGLILATGIGNLSRLDVDFFALSLRLATPAVIRQIHATGREVHVWTLDDEASIARAMLAGADNILTSDTLLGVRMRRWFNQLNEAQRILLRLELSIPGFAQPRLIESDL